jgi:puromycin-sensitive aminopeptidase
MENHAVDVLVPEWQMWEQFVYNDLASSMELDSLESSHPIEVAVGPASEVDEIFDAVRGKCMSAK